MQINTPAAPAVARQQVRREPPVQPSPKWLRPGWPLAVLFIGFPVWWVLGLGDFAFLIFSIPMVVDLLRKRQIVTPRAFGGWLLFLVWVLAGVLTLQVNAPGTVSGESGSRYLTWTYRLCWYVTVTVAMLYVLNNRKDLSTLRVARIMSWMFVWITLGGLAGVIAPQVQFHSVMELLLPSSIANNGFVNSLIHPSFAQIQDVLGYAAPRPSAPFAYANTWGVNFACFLPFFVYGWCLRGSGWRRVVGPVVLALATIPVIYSLNRGLWIALGAAILFVVVRAGFTGRPNMLAWLVAGGLALVLVLAFTPLGVVVSTRLTNPNSNAGRTNLSQLAIRSVTAKSPVVGLGSTRTVQGSFNSISSGRTAACPHCSPPALGTQGQMWLVLVSQGLMGLFFFVLFFGLQILYQIRRRGPTVTLGLSVLLVSFVTMPVYNSIGTALLAIMVAVGLMTGDALKDPLARAPRGGWVRKPATLGGYANLMRQNAVIVIVCIVAGGVVASTWQAVQGTRTVATVAVMVPREAPNPIPASPRQTMDSTALLVRSAPVINAMSSATGHQISSDDTDLAVTATPSSQVLHITYTADTAAVATKAVNAAASAFTALIAQQAQERRALQLDMLGARAISLNSSINAQAAVLHRLQAPGINYLDNLEAKLLRERTNAAIVDARSVAIEINRVTSRQPTPVVILAPTSTSPESDVWRVSIATGLALGLMVGVLLGWLRHLHGPRLRRTSDVSRWTDLPVLAVVPAGASSRDKAAALDGTLLTLKVFEPTAFVSASARIRSGAALAGQLDDRLRSADPSPHHRPAGPHRGQRVVLVVPQGTRAPELALVQHRLSQNGSGVAGVVFNRRTSSRQPVK